MEFNDCLYIIPSADKSIKLVFEGPPIEDNGDMTLSEIAEWFDMTVDEALNTKFGIFTIDEEEKQNGKLVL